jgi:hypothetical protein
VRVVGNKAKEVFTQHLQAMQQKDAKVIVSFVIGDIQPASYSYVDKISKETKAGCSIDGRLIAITLNLVYLTPLSVFPRIALISQAKKVSPFSGETSLARFI